MTALSVNCVSVFTLLVGFRFVNGSSTVDKDTKAAKNQAAKQGMDLGLPGGSALYPFGQSPALSYFSQQDFYPGYHADSYYFPETPASSKPDTDTDRNRLVVLVILLFNLLNSATESPTTTASTPTTATTTSAITSPSGNCQWYPWSSCSNPCRGSRYRTRMCLGNTQTDVEACNTQTGYLPDGLWYRASNCHDYRWFDALANYQDATAACLKLGAKLASTGMRNDHVRTEVLSNGMPESAIVTYIGVTDQAQQGIYVWSDGHVGDPSFWQFRFPINPNHRCAFIEFRDPFSLNDRSCASLANYLCEKVSE